MIVEESYIILREVRFHAFHGVMPQERKVGADFTVSLKVGIDLSVPMVSDSVADEVVKKAMAQPSQLLEHAAGRIGRDVIAAFPQVKTVDVMLTKLNPPMGADCQGAGVELHLINDKTRL